MKELHKRNEESIQSQMQTVFASIFILQNRFRTAYEKVHDELTTKQWLMLYMIRICPQPHTLTNVGSYMGCSRQNAKQLAMSLSKKGYVRLILGAQNSINIELTEKAAEYEKKMGEKHAEVLRLLFSDFSDEEISLFNQIYIKLYTGVERIENL